jgi:hypothetical protein
VLVSGAERGNAKARRMFRADTTTCDNIRRRWVARPPSWLQQLHKASSIRGEGNVKALLGRVLEPVRRLGTRLNGDPPPEPSVPVVLRGNGYTIGRALQEERFRTVNPSNLDIPAVGDSILDPLEFVAYPFNKLFSEPYLRRCMVDDPPPVRGHRSLNLAEGVSRGELVDALKHMLFFSDDPAVLEAPTNGLFALLKSLDEDGDERHRLVFDGVHGNKYFSMAKFQELYDELVAAEPELAAQIGCGPKVMNIGSPADFTDLPPGARSRSSGDMKNYFYQFAQLAFLLRYQGLFDVDGADVGRPDVPVVRVGLKVLGMGSWISALVAHAVHWCILHRGLVDVPLRMARPERASASHQEDYATVCKMAASSPDGRVAWPDVPERLRRAFVEALPDGAGVGSSRLDEMRLPPRALACEPLQSVSHLGPRDWIRLSTSLIGGQRNGRAAVMALRRRNEREQVDEYLGLCSVYCDDQHTFLYGPGPDDAPPEPLDWQVADTHRLMIVLVADQAGLLQNFRKLKWANRDTAPLLGIDTEFLPDGRVRFAMSPERRTRLKQEIEDIVALARTGARFVEEDQLESVLGDLVWCLLVKRPLLSGLRVVYRALRSSKRPPGLVWLSKTLVRELATMAGLIALAETTTADFTDTLWTFDASGASKWGNGGFGVAYRTGLTPEVATELTTPLGPTRLSRFRIQADGKAPGERLGDPARAGPAARAAHFLRFSYKPNRKDWKIARAGEFDFAPRIVLKAESLAGVKAFDSASRLKSHRGKLVALLGDNTGSLHGLSKGRSSVGDLNRICRRLAALQILRDVEARWAWINSKANPSDYPSRLWIKRQQRVWFDMGFVPRGDPGGRRFRRHLHMLPFPRPRQGGDPRQATEWLRDLVAENGEAKNPGPNPPVVAYHLTLESRARALAGTGALQVPTRGTREPFKGILPRPETLKVDLLGAKVSEGSLRRYLKAFSGFCYYMREDWHRHDTYADHLFAFVRRAHAEGIQTKSGIEKLLAFLPFISDEAKTITLRARKALDSWAELQPKKSWPPLPWSLALLFAWDLLSSSDPADVDTGLGLLVAHHIYARGCELDALRVDDVVMPEEARAVSQHQQVIFRATKAGRPQTATVDSSFVRLLLRFSVERARVREPDQVNPLVFCFGKKGFLSRFKASQVRLGYPTPFFVRHSARHGGATKDFATRLRDEIEISTRLRHANPKTTKVYLQDAAVIAVLQEVPHEVSEHLQRLGGQDRLISLITNKLRLRRFVTPVTSDELHALVHQWNLGGCAAELRMYADGYAPFSARRIGRGEILGEFQGELISADEKAARYHEVTAPYLLGPFNHPAKGVFFLDATDPRETNWTRFIRFAPVGTTPNVAFKQGSGGTLLGDRVWVEALADLPKGSPLEAARRVSTTWTDV